MVDVNLEAVALPRGRPMQPFVLNRHDRIVFPSNFVPELDLSVVDSLDQLDSVIRRDFETKAPTGSDILQPRGGGCLRRVATS